MDVHHINHDLDLSATGDAQALKPAPKTKHTHGQDQSYPNWPTGQWRVVEDSDNAGNTWRYRVVGANVIARVYPYASMVRSVLMHDPLTIVTEDAKHVYFNGQMQPGH